MKSFSQLSLVLALVSVTLWAQGQSPKHAPVMVPETTIERLEDRGIRAHTNHLILEEAKPSRPGGGGPSGETPASIRGVYNLPSTGGSQTVAIVDAFDYPTAANDLGVFSSQFGLPAMPDCNSNGNVAPCFKKVFATGSQPQASCGWAQEAALAIEWPHPMAPNARTVRVKPRTTTS